MKRSKRSTRVTVSADGTGVVSHAGVGMLRELAGDTGLVQEVIVGHASSDLWRETVIMACAQGSAEQRGRLLDGILRTADQSSGKTARQLKLLAAACRETAILAPPAVLKRIDERIRTLVPPRGVREGRSLVTVGESILDYLPTDPSTLSAAQAAACVRTAALVNGPRALDMLSGYAADPRPELTHELARSWKYFDPETYARRVLADAPLTMRGRWDQIYVDGGAVPFLHMLKNLHSCHVNLWNAGDITNEVQTLSRLTDLHHLAVLGDVVPNTLPELARLRTLEEFFVNITDGWPKSVDFIGRLTGLQDLGLINAGQVRDFTFLRELTCLTRLNLWSNPVTAWMNEVAIPERLTSVVYGGPVSHDVEEAFVSRFPNITNFTY